MESFVLAAQFVAEIEATGMSPRFLSQNMAQKEPEKKMPSTAAKAIIRLTKLALVELHHFESPVGFASDLWYCFNGVE